MLLKLKVQNSFNSSSMISQFLQTPNNKPNPLVTKVIIGNPRLCGSVIGETSYLYIFMLPEQNSCRISPSKRK